jgi:hypothetical protein
MTGRCSALMSARPVASSGVLPARSASIFCPAPADGESRYITPVIIRSGGTRSTTALSRSCAQTLPRAERETISEFGQINRRPRPFALSAHGPPHRCPNRNQAGSVLRYFCGALWSHAAWASCRPHRMRDRAHRPAQSSPAGFLRAPGGSTDEPSHYRTREPVHLLPVLVRLALRNPDCPQLARPPAGVIHADFRRRQLPAIRPTTLHPNRVNR